MAWRHVLGQRPALWGDETFLEGHTFVPAHQRSAHADVAVTETQFGGDVTDLEPARLTFPDDSADVRESRQEEGADEVRLELPGLSTLHSLRIRSTSPAVMTSLTSARSWTTRRSASPTVASTTILRFCFTSGCSPYLTARISRSRRLLSTECLAEDVKNSITERLTLFLQLLEEPLEHLALTGVLGNQVP